MALNETELLQYTLVPFATYETLESKLQALLAGEILFLKKFERNEGVDVLVRLVQKKFTVTQVSYDVTVRDEDIPRYWTTYNIGLNDISLFTCFKFAEDAFTKENKYMINDRVLYVSVDGLKDAAIIEEVYQHNTDPTKFAYRLSRDGAVYGEDELYDNSYM
ncbi:virion structural protein [Bacillus phage Moonbeam]|uniref:Uncharacterized protein n=1 Tax=Bacillus phage Moonbeam TaxID=1540091 RepID=A0A0A0RVA9_9CAUD|nr:virion structural protein [Bacillus phage Moonbeam]AIW03593.1 hypothetical protein CPT_Moonbeam195 [Bacillus phage Moonbeam]